MKYSIDDTLQVLSLIKKEDVHYYLSEGRNQGAMLRRGMPFFFYQSGIFSSPHHKGRSNIHPDREFCTKCNKNEELTPIHLSLLEYLFGTATYLSPKYHKLTGKIKAGAIENFIFSFLRQGRSRARAEAVFKKLLSTFISVYKIEEGEDALVKTFPIFDFLQYDEATDTYEYSFSDMSSFLYAIEPLVSYASIQNIHEASFPIIVSYLVNYTVTLKSGSNHLSIPNLMNALDYFPEDKEVREETFNGISDFLSESKNRAVIKSLYGITLDVETIRGKEVFILPRRREKGTVSVKPDTVFFVEAIIGGQDMEKFAFLNSKDTDPLEDEIAERIKDGIEEELEKRKNKVVDFSDLNVKSYSAILDITEEFGLSVGEASVILAGYCEYHLAFEVKQSPDKFIIKWKAWVERNLEDSRNRIVPKGRKEFNEPNKGDAKNIEMSQDIEATFEKHGISRLDGLEYFTKFKNYYLSVDGYAVNWLPRFENWIIDAKKRTAEDTLKKGNTVVENNFYYARIVSEEVKGFIKKGGYSVSDVLSGELEIEEITFRHFPVPSKYGKGKETLFSFKDKALNEQILKQYTTPQTFDDGDKMAEILESTEVKIKEDNNIIEGEIE